MHPIKAQAGLEQPPKYGKRSARAGRFASHSERVEAARMRRKARRERMSLDAQVKRVVEYGDRVTTGVDRVRKLVFIAQHYNRKLKDYGQTN